MHCSFIRTQRLQLVSATVEMLRVVLSDRQELGNLIEAEVPSSWPAELLDEDAIRWSVDAIQGDPENAAWYLYLFVLQEPRTLIGAGGFKGPPSNRTVELGYSILQEFRRQGYAVEATRGMVAHAFAEHEVDRVIAQTLPELAPSIGVLQKCGFQLLGPGSEEGAICFELRRHR